MPYRRLPNTDNARIKALKIAVDKGYLHNVHDLPISLKIWSEAKNFLPKFEKAHHYYRQCYEKQVTSSKKHQESVKTARMFLSHFIQVLNLSMIRGEIRETYRSYYDLPSGFTLPDLTSESAIEKWGKPVIEGERRRVAEGGIPIYNPTIAKVSVHYEIFREGYHNQQNLKNLTAKSLEALASLRKKADEIILEMWNQIETRFEPLPDEQRIEKCRDYGVVYYYRGSEKRKVVSQ